MSPCAACGVPAKIKKMGVAWMVVPKRVTPCLLHQNPHTHSCGSVAGSCRTGICCEKPEAVRQWEIMQEQQRESAKEKAHGL